jgi:S-adenosyl-L-methionine hydrolase (adenosine-forming)
MSIISFLSDFGYKDSYVASVKAKMLSKDKNLNIIDISHGISPFNIIEASYILRTVYNDFPAGTVHLVCVHAPARQGDKFLALKINGHYFLGADNGLFSLIYEGAPEAIVELDNPQNDYIFPAKSILAPAAVALASGVAIEDLGLVSQEMTRMLNRQLRITKNLISGHIIHVDRYGNLITNISKAIYEQVRVDRDGKVFFARESADLILPSYGMAESGDCVLVFNSNGFLEISINQGNASELLGLHIDYPVNIKFTPEL